MTKAKVDECPFPKYVPLSGEAFCENLEVKYTLYHDHIPQPTIGYKAKWSEINKDVPNILADERSCPAMMRREEIGITIRMPYTATFYRDGSIEIKEFYGKEDNTTYRYHPRQGKGIVLNRSSNEEKSFAEFPACLMTLPQPIDSQASLGLFVLGDIRLNTWIIDSGVFLLDVPKDYALIITPVAHKKDIPGVVLHQGVSESVPRIMGSLKIPVKIDFSQIPDNQDSVTIPRGEPLLSWILVKLPKVSISEIKVKQDININDNTYILLSPNGLSSELQTVNDHICELTRFNKDYDLSIKLSGFENKIFVFLKNNKYSYTRINELAKKLNLTREQTISSLNKLTKLGLVSILNHIDPLPAPEIKVESWMGKSRKDAWNEIYKTGRYYRTVITSPSEEIQSLFKLLKRDNTFSQINAVDIGCGIGAETYFMAQNGLITTGIDISEIAINLAENRYKHENMTFKCCNLQNTGVNSNSVDFVNDRGTFQHLFTDQEQLAWLKEIKRIIKPGGWLFLRGIYSENPFPHYISPTLRGTISGYILGLNKDRVTNILGNDFDIVYARKIPWINDNSKMDGYMVLARRKGNESKLSFITK